MSIHEKISHTAITVDEYNNQWEERAKSSMKGLSVDERKTLMHRKYNLERRTKTQQDYKISEDLKSSLDNLTEQQYWYVITEDWCADSAYNLAVIEKIANESQHIDLKLIERDKDTDIIDQYLTNGGRAIPILLSFDSDNNLLFKWGPRPKNQIDYRASLVEQGLEKTKITAKVLERYDNGAWINVEKEVHELLNNSKQ